MPPPHHTRDETEKQSDSQDLASSKEKTIDKTKTTATKDNTFDLTKAGSTGTGIIDIMDDPDVAVWSKGIMNKTNIPTDKVQEPYHIKSTATQIEYREGEKKQSDLEDTVDPANKGDVAKAINLGTSLTDKEAKRQHLQKSKSPIRIA
jgi:hypothetical protein